jgi:hypothetical protein
MVWDRHKNGAGLNVWGSYEILFIKKPKHYYKCRKNKLIEKYIQHLKMIFLL